MCALVFSWHSNSSLIFLNDRWDGHGLTGHSEVIFKALDNLVKDVTANYLDQQGGECEIAKVLHDAVRFRVNSWLYDVLRVN